MRDARPMRFLQLLKLAGLTAVLSLLISSPSSAHEVRHVGPQGQYTLVVGWLDEPAFANEVNGVDIRVLRTSDKAPINTNRGDVVDLDVEVQYLAAENAKADVIDSMKLPSKPTITPGTDNRYASWFKPVRPGAYAFRLTGKISDASDPKAGEVSIDETFVCGKGSKTEHGFVCLEEPVVFPAPGMAKGGSR